MDKEYFHKCFRRRLNDKYVRNWNSKIQNSNTFTILPRLNNNYEKKQYLTKVKDPHIRDIFTRLRINRNLLKTSKSQGPQENDICTFCNVKSETVSHFILRCSKYDNVQSDMFNKIILHEPAFRNLAGNDILSYILDLKSDKNIGVCCNFLSKIYKQRELDNLRDLS